MAESATAETGIPDPALLDLGRLDQWIDDKLPGRGEVLTAIRFGEGTGIGNALFLLRRGVHEWVLRRPPAIKNDPSASDTMREWRILRALDGTAVPHPHPRLVCTEIDVIGAPFMIMGKVAGYTPGFTLPPFLVDNSPAHHDLAMAYVDGLVELQKVDWIAGGLEGLGKPEGFLARQVPRWMGQLDRYRTRDLPELDFLADWLRANTPEMSPPTIIHGDYSPFNVMVAADLPARLAAIIDWDTGTIGDPLLDIGHLLARWTEPGEESILGPQAGDLSSYPTRREMAARYAERTGRDLGAIAFYECLALFKLGIILEGTYARERSAGKPDSQNSMAQLVPNLMRGAAAFARGARV